MNQSLPVPSLINPDASIPHKERLGRCYELAGNLAHHNPDVFLVHGTIQGLRFPRMGHAWVILPDGQVWEPTSNQVWKRDIFQGFFRPQVNKKYDYQAMLRECIRHEHWGPW